MRVLRFNKHTFCFQSPWRHFFSFCCSLDILVLTFDLSQCSFHRIMDYFELEGTQKSTTHKYIESSS